MGEKLELNYLLTEEQCVKYDEVLERVYKAATATNTMQYNVNDKSEECNIIMGFVRDGYVAKKDGGFGDYIPFVCTPSGSTFVRNGGFIGERNKEIHRLITEKKILLEVRDLKSKKKYWVIGIVVSVLLSLSSIVCSIITAK